MSKPTLEEYLAGVKGRCEKATKGPWMAEGHCIAAKVDGGRPNGEVIARMSGSADHLTSAQRIANAELAAHSRTDVEALLNLVTALLGVIEYEADPGNNEEGPAQQAANAAQFLNELESLVPEENP